MAGKAKRQEVVMKTQSRFMDNVKSSYLVLVIGIADAQLGAPEQELEANVTIIDQVSGKFYSTQEQPRCWTRLTTQLRLTGTIEESWRLDGRLYCASALAALAGPGSVTLDEIEYSSLMKPATE